MFLISQNKTYKQLKQILPQLSVYSFFAMSRSTQLNSNFSELRNDTQSEECMAIKKCARVDVPTYYLVEIRRVWEATGVNAKLIMHIEERTPAGHTSHPRPQ